jgi:hypothetical protein
MRSGLAGRTDQDCRDDARAALRIFGCRLVAGMDCRRFSTGWQRSWWRALTKRGTVLHEMEIRVGSALGRWLNKLDRLLRMAERPCLSAAIGGDCNRCRALVRLSKRRAAKILHWLGYRDVGSSATRGNRLLRRRMDSRWLSFRDVILRSNADGFS